MENFKFEYTLPFLLLAGAILLVLFIWLIVVIVRSYMIRRLIARYKKETAEMGTLTRESRIGREKAVDVAELEKVLEVVSGWNDRHAKDNHKNK